MQLSAAEVTDFSKETAETIKCFYGADDSNQLKARFAKNCILARRLVERGCALCSTIQRGVRDGRRRRQLGWSQDLKTQLMCTLQFWISLVRR
jgi:hypothetical protein